MDIARLPGGDLIAAGLADLSAGRETDAAWLVLIGSPRLRRLGFSVPAPPVEWFDSRHDAAPEHRLYERLADSHVDSAHSRYNALIRLLVSFERAAECIG